MWRTVLVIFSLLSTLCQGAERHDTDKITLSDLDNVIRHASEYDRVREDRLDSCRTALMHSKTLEQKYLLYFTMRQTFDRYRTDSATFYAVRSLDAAKELGRQDYISASSLALAKQYMTSGMSYDALATLNRVDRRALSEKSREELYLFYMSIYESLEGLGIDQSLKQYYSSKASVYKDSIASQFPDNDDSALLPPPCADLARLLSPAITCWRIRRFRGGVPDRRRDPGRSGASCQSAC